MDFVLKRGMHTTIAMTLYRDILTNRATYCHFIGGSAVAGTVYSQTADDTYAYELATRNEMLATKRISSADVSLVIPRYDWTSGTVYDMFDDQYSPTYAAASGVTAIEDAQFFVVTDEYNVYKCLDNNNNAASTTKPTGTSYLPMTTSDGYVWKFMYNIPLASINKFTSSTHIPVQTALQNAYYSAGRIEDISVTNSGSGYTTATVSISGDGTGAAATAVINAGQIIDVIITNPGIGYTACFIRVIGDGTGATLRGEFSIGDINTYQSNVELLAVDGALSAVRVLSGGAGYSSATVQIVGDGQGATATATVVNGAIKKINLTDPGSGYTKATLVITGVGTSIVPATARAIISPKGGHGKNAVYELYASRIQFYTSISTETNQGLAVRNDYRQVGLIHNICEFGNESRFYGVTGSPLWLFGCVTTNAQQDDLLQDSVTGKQFRVYSVSGTSILVQNLDSANPSLNSTLKNLTRGGNMTVNSIIAPTVDKFSGDLMFIDNIDPTQQSPDQIITLKTAIKF